MKPKLAVVGFDPAPRADLAVIGLVMASPKCQHFASTLTRRLGVAAEASGLLVIGIPLDKRGRCWRMAADNVGEARLRWPGVKPAPPHRRTFRTRETALKWARRTWRSARVELASYGLRVLLPAGDPHLLRAVLDRATRAEAKRSSFGETYRADFAEVERRVLAAMGAPKGILDP